MSTDELIAKILILLRKHEDISVRVSFSTVKEGTITTISIKESTGIQKTHFSSRKSTKKPEEKKKVKKNPSRKKRDEKRLQNFLSRNCERGLSSEAAATTPADPPTTPQFPDPTTHQDPSTTPRPSDTPPIPPDSPTPQPPDLSATPPSMASRRKTKAGRSRGLEKTGAGNEERTVWRPAVLSPIPQLDGSTSPRPPETTTTPPVPATTPQPPASDQPLTPRPADPATTPPPPASDPSLTPRPSDPSTETEEKNNKDHECKHLIDYDAIKPNGYRCYGCNVRLFEVDTFICLRCDRTSCMTCHNHHPRCKLMRKWYTSHTALECIDSVAAI